jgi:hypothetical protein
MQFVIVLHSLVNLSIPGRLAIPARSDGSTAEGLGRCNKPGSGNAAHFRHEPSDSDSP